MQATPPPNTDTWGKALDATSKTDRRFSQFRLY